MIVVGARGAGFPEEIVGGGNVAEKVSRNTDRLVLLVRLLSRAPVVAA